MARPRKRIDYKLVEKLGKIHSPNGPLLESCHVAVPARPKWLDSLSVLGVCPSNSQAKASGDGKMSPLRHDIGITQTVSQMGIPAIIRISY